VRSADELKNATTSEIVPNVFRILCTLHSFIKELFSAWLKHGHLTANFKSFCKVVTAPRSNPTIVAQLSVDIPIQLSRFSEHFLRIFKTVSPIEACSFKTSQKHIFRKLVFSHFLNGHTVLKVLYKY